MQTMSIAQHLAHAISARQRCQTAQTPVQADGIDITERYWREMSATWEARIVEIAREHLPSGSGIDGGTTVDLAASTDEKLVLICSFHHMDPHGMYDGWTDHAVIVRASLVHGIAIRITGRDRDGIKDYLHEVYHAALTAEVTI